MSQGGRVDDVAAAKREAARLKQVLDSTFDRYKRALGHTEIEYQGDMHAHMCIDLAGFLEQLLYCAITGYLKSASGDKTSNFALSWFRYAPNLSPDGLEKLIRRFGEPWSTDLAAFLGDNDRRDTLGRLLRIRNDRAHGSSYGGSAPNVTSYKSLVDELYGWIGRTILA